MQTASGLAGEDGEAEPALVLLYALDLEPCALYPGQSVAIQMAAAGDGLPERRRSLLQPSRGRLLHLYVLHETELA